MIAWEDVGQIATAISVLVGAGTWLITHLWDRHRDKVAHTTTLISNLSTCDGLAEADYFVTCLVNANTPVKGEDLDQTEERYVVAILNYYEHICEACRARVVDHDTIMNLRGKLMQRTWAICAPYIREIRTIQRRRLYSEFEKFTAALPPDKDPISPLTEGSKTDREARSNSPNSA